MTKTVRIFLLCFLLVCFSACARDEHPSESDVTVSSDTSPIVTADTSEPIVTESVMTDSTVTEPPVTEPPVTEPTVTEPTVTEPTVTEPTVTEPTVTEPTVTEPPVTEPPVTEPPVTEPPVVEPEPFDFASSDLGAYIRLGKYLGMEVLLSMPEPVRETDVDEQIARSLMTLPNEAMDYERACRMGDTVCVDYIGYAGDTVIDGVGAADELFILGESEMADYLELRIVGMRPGEEKLAEFPEDGISVLIRLNFVLPEFTDALAVRYFGYESADAMKAAVRTELSARYDRAVLAAKEEAAWTKALANADVLAYPEEALADAVADCRRSYEKLAEEYGLSYEEMFLLVYGLPVSEAEVIINESAKNIVAQQLLLYAIARDLGMDTSDQALEAELAETAKVLGTDVDTLVATFGKTRQALKEEKLYDAVIEKIVAQARFASFAY